MDVRGNSSLEQTLVKDVYGIARLVGTLDGELERRHGIFTETLKRWLPEAAHQGIIPAHSLRMRILGKSALKDAVQMQELRPTDEIKHLLNRFPPSAAEPVCGKVVGVNSISGGRGHGKISLNIHCPVAQGEIRALSTYPDSDQRTFWLWVPVLKVHSASFSHPEQRLLTERIAEEVFMEQILPFERVEPVLILGS